jgi:hypothetical protein
MHLLPALSHIEINVRGVERARSESENGEDPGEDNDVAEVSLTDKSDARKIDESQNSDDRVNRRLRKAALVDIPIRPKNKEENQVK